MPHCLAKSEAFLMCRMRTARVSGNQADGQRPLVKVPHFFSGSADNERSRLDTVFLEGQPQARDLLRLEIVHKHLAAGKAKIVDLCHSGFRILADADDQAEPQGLPAVVGGYSL